MGLDIRVTDFSTLSRRVRPGKYADWIRENVGDRQPKRFAETFSFDPLFSPRPNWATYDRR